MATPSSVSPPSPSASDDDHSILDPTSPPISSSVAIVAGTLSASIVVITAIIISILLWHRRSGHRHQRKSAMDILEAQQLGRFMRRTTESTKAKSTRYSDSSSGDDSASESSSDATSNRHRRKNRVIWRYRWRIAPRRLRRQESNNCPPSWKRIAVTQPEVLVAAPNTSTSQVGPALGHSGELRNLQQIAGTFGSPQTASFDLPSASEPPPAYENRDTP